MRFTARQAMAIAGASAGLLALLSRKSAPIGVDGLSTAAVVAVAATLVMFALHHRRLDVSASPASARFVDRLRTASEVALGAAVASAGLVWLLQVVRGTTAAPVGMGEGLVHPMGVAEHALRDGAAVAPIVFLVALAAGAIGRRRPHRVGTVERVHRAAAWSTVGGLVAGAVAVVPVVGLTATGAAAAQVPEAACNATTAARSYDVAAISAFVPYTRWANDAGIAQPGPDGIQHLTDGDPNGMIFVLQRDKAAVLNWAAPVIGSPQTGYAGDPAGGRRVRPRPLVLRANEGDCIEVTFTNELNPLFLPPLLPQVDPQVSMHAFGVSYAPNTGDGSSTGYNTDSTVGIGESTTYYWRAPKSEGLYLFRDMGMPAAGTVDGGGAIHGLYGGLVVEPAGARWFDPTTGAELSSSIPQDQYKAAGVQSGDLYVESVIALADGKRFREAIQLSQDVVPVVAPPVVPGQPLPVVPERFGFNYGSEAEYKRDNYKDQWCADCVSEETSLSSWTYGEPSTVKLGGGTGPWYPEVPEYGNVDPLSVPAGVVAANVEDCRLWLTNLPGETRPVSCFTANVVRAYQGDPIKIRFGHAGVYETHVFHLHAHTWAAEPDDEGPAGEVPPRPTASVQPRATTIDSQTYGPWTGFTANLNYGAGARIGTVGDAIFHCHLYPHFAAGFWALLRSEDVNATGFGANPDGQRVNKRVPLREVGADVVPVNPEVPPVKNDPTPGMPGYPRFMPGEFGWRAPQPYGGIFQRQFNPITGAPVLNVQGAPVDAPAVRIVAGKGLDPAVLTHSQSIVAAPTVSTFVLTFNNETTVPLARTASALQVKQALEALQSIDGVLVTGTGQTGDPWVVRLVFWRVTNNVRITSTTAGVTITPDPGFNPSDPVLARQMYRLALEEHAARTFHDPTYIAGRAVNPAKQPLPGAPVVDPCPAGARQITYRASVIQAPVIYNNAEWVDVQGRMMVADQDVDAIMTGQKAPEPFFFRANQGDCINFELTNRTPNYIGNDVYQSLMQTNMVGGHIHLVNFDVLASDGSSNGWNYQEAAFTEDQATFNAGILAGTQPCVRQLADPTAVPAVAAVMDCTVQLPAAADYDPVAEAQAVRGDPGANPPVAPDPAVWRKNGQTLKERWFADYELRTVFMHDHHFAAVMQQRGMFNALIIEPAGFDSRDPVTGAYRQPINAATHGAVCGATCVGAAYGAKMDLVGPGAADDFREFGVALHDYIPLIIPPTGAFADLTLADAQAPANAIAPPPLGPQGIPANDQGGMAINYRNEPMALRAPVDPAGLNIDDNPGVPGVPGATDAAYTFSSRIWGDPATPVLHVYRGDNVRFRLIQGSHEEQHQFTVHGLRWKKDARDPASPYINARAMGVSEAFNIDDVAIGCGLGQSQPCADTPPSVPRVTDLMYGGTSMEELWFGAWGIMRVFDQTTDSGVGGTAVLPQLPDNRPTLPAGVALPAPDQAAIVPRAPVNVSCPAGTALKTFNVSVIDADIPYNRYGEHDPYGLAYVPTSDVAAIRAGTKQVEPLVLRANEGDCVVVNLRNDVDWATWSVHGDLGVLDGDAPMPLEPLAPGAVPEGVVGAIFPQWRAGQRVSMHPGLVRYDARMSDGTTIGYNMDQTAGPGETVTYLWHADEVVYDDPANPIGLTDGELGVVPLLEFGDVRGHRHHGLLAALVIGPANATYHDQVTGTRVTTGAQVDVRVPGVAEDYRDSVVFHHNGLNLRDVNGAIIPDPIPADWPDLGERAISYRNAPFHHRLQQPQPLNNPQAVLNPRGFPFNVDGFGKDLANVFSSTYVVNPLNGRPIGDPDTPIIRAYQGDPLRVHVVQSADRGRMLETEIAGHNWLEHAFDAGSVRAGVQGAMATGSGFTFHIAAAGGDMQSVGDYRYGVVHGVSGMSGGSWGLLRVYQTPAAGTERTLSPLASSQNPYAGGNPIQVLEQDQLLPAVAPTVTLTASSDFAVLPTTPGTSVTVTATVTARGSRLAAQDVVFTWGGAPGDTKTVVTDQRGVASVQVPVRYPAGIKTVTAVVNPPTTAPTTASIDLAFLDATADRVRPTVGSVTPSNAAVDINPNGTVRVSFSEAMHPDTVTANSVRLFASGQVSPIGASVSLSADRRTATLTPDVPLSLGSSYQVQVRTTVTDLVGNALQTQYTSSFTTWNVPSAPGAPVGTFGDTSVSLAWNAPASDGGTPVTDYMIQYSTDGTNWSTFTDGVSTARTATVTGLSNGTTYWFHVAAVNAAGRGSMSSNSDAYMPRGMWTAGYQAVNPVRLFDTRPGEPQGAVVVSKQAVVGGSVLRVKVAGVAGVPASGVGAIQMNVTVTEPTAAGFVTAYPCGAIPTASNLNFVAGQTIPNSVIAPLSPAGEVCFFSNVSTHLLADLSGWFKEGISFTPVSPSRVFDTRPTEPQANVPVSKQIYGNGLILRVKVTGSGGVPNADVSAVALNVTVTETAGSGFVTVYPCGTRPDASNLNFVAGQTIPNQVIAPVAEDGRVCFYTSAPAHLVADVSGWFETGIGYTKLSPTRVFDTRPGLTQGAVAVQKITVGPARILRVRVTGAAGVPASGVGAVALNVTVTEPTDAGFVTVYPCGSVPTASNLNFVADQTIPNSVLAPVSDTGEVCFYSNVPTHLIADVSGWFAR